MKARPLSCLLAVVVVTTLAACGSGGGKQASGRPQPDGTYKRADIAVQANKVCQATKDSLKTIKPVTNGNDPAQIAAFMKRLLPATKKQAAGLAALKPAPDVAADWTALNAKEGQIVAMFSKVLAKAEKKDPSGQKDLADGTKLGPQFQVLVKKVGASNCS